jgi:hypothetical protein
VLGHGLEEVGSPAHADQSFCDGVGAAAAIRSRPPQMIEKPPRRRNRHGAPPVVGSDGDPVAAPGSPGSPWDPLEPSTPTAEPGTVVVALMPPAGSTSVGAPVVEVEPVGVEVGAPDVGGAVDGTGCTVVLVVVGRIGDDPPGVGHGATVVTAAAVRTPPTRPARTPKVCWIVSVVVVTPQGAVVEVVEEVVDEVELVVDEVELVDEDVELVLEVVDEEVEVVFDPHAVLPQTLGAAPWAAGIIPTSIITAPSPAAAPPSRRPCAPSHRRNPTMPTIEPRPAHRSNYRFSPWRRPRSCPRSR